MSAILQSFHRNVKMNYLPKKIYLYIGGYGGSSYAVKFDGKQLFYSQADSGFRGENELLALPSEKKWIKFWKKLNKINIWEWEKEYYDPDVLDGTQWEVKINFDGAKKIVSGGSNAYPKGFKTFLKAVRKLIGGLEIE
jgi:hypothetical protein